MHDTRQIKESLLTGSSPSGTTKEKEIASFTAGNHNYYNCTSIWFQSSVIIAWKGILVMYQTVR